MEKVFEIYVANPEPLWEAIADGEIRSKYNFGARDQLGLDARLRCEMGRPALSQGSWARGRSSRSTRRVGSSTHRPCAVERRGEERGRIQGDVGNEPIGEQLPAS